MENQKQKNQSSYFTDSISEISGKLVEQKQLVDFDNRFKRKLKWHQKLFNIKSPWIASMLKAFAVILRVLCYCFHCYYYNLLLNKFSSRWNRSNCWPWWGKTKRAVEEKYGLNQPLIIRYGIYLKNIIHLDFGISLSVFPGEKINDFVWVRFYKSFLIGIFSVMLTLVMGIPLGVYVGMNPDKLPDHIATLVVSIFSSIPSLVFALWLLLIGRKLNLPYIFNEKDISTYVLPGLALSLGSIIVYIKYIRTELNRELNSQHCKFCYLKGITKRRFVWTHALKPALFPIATFFPVVIFGSFIGSVFIEQIFFITGSGGLLLNAITSKDFNIILFMVTLFSLLTILSYTWSWCTL